MSLSKDQIKETVILASIKKLRLELADLQEIKKGDKGIDGENGKDGRDGIDGKNGENGKNGLNGANGNDGKDADPVRTAELASKLAQDAILPLIPSITTIEQDLPILGEKIRDSLELLKGEDRLDVSAIKGIGKRLLKLSDDIINRAISILDSRTSFLINKVSNLENKVNQGGGGGNYVRDGWSDRFDEQITVNSIAEALDTIFEFALSVILSTDPVAQVKEYGDPIATVDLSVTTHKGSNLITTVNFYRGTSVIYTVPAPIGVGGVEIYTETTPVTNTTTFKAIIGDGSTTKTSNLITYTYIYPYYWGGGVQGLTPAQIQGLTKSVTIKANKSFAEDYVDQVPYFAYPASYGLLTTIRDTSGLEYDIATSWTIRTENFTMLDGTTQSYYIYEFNNVNTNSNFTISFYY